MPRLKEINASRIKDFRTCRRADYLRHVLGLVPRARSEKLDLGTVMHAAIAAAYHPQSSLPEQPHIPCRDAAAASKAYEEEAAKARQALVDSGVTDLAKHDEAIALGRKMLPAYFEGLKAIGDDPIVKVLGVEVPFSVPLRHPTSLRKLGAQYRGRMDLIAVDALGRFWVREFKTATQFPSPTVLRLDIQGGLYQLALAEMFPSAHFCGVLYDVLRKADPARARTPMFQRFKILHGAAARQQLRYRLWWAWREINRESVWPPTPGVHCDWWCGYRQLCLALEDGCTKQDWDLLVDGMYLTPAEQAAMGITHAEPAFEEVA